MSDLFSNEVQIIESNARCSLNSEYMEKLVMDEANKRSKELDELVKGIKDIIFSDSEELTTSELESCCMKLSLMLYDFETQAEYASIRADIASLLKADKYNYVMALRTDDSVKLTVLQRQALAQSQVQAEEATVIMTKNVMKLLTNKKTAAYELLATIKKVLSARISSMDFNS